MPEPKPNESQKAYVSRCIAHLVKNEGKTQKQAAGQCYGMYDQMKKKARKRAHAG
jgi:hypothetical protein